jgi:hypothetical protein
MKKRNCCFSYLRLSAFICGLFCLPAYAQDVHEIVRRAFELNQKSEELSRDYAFLQGQRIRMMDGDGHVKRETWKTEDITLLDGSPYRRLVERDGKSLTPAEQQQEQDRLRWNGEQRQKESPAQRERRLAEARRRYEDRTAPFREVPQAFDFKLAGEEAVNGTASWVVEATPKPGYRPKSSAASMLLKLEGRLWIAKSDYGLVKADAKTLGTISYGAILFRLAKGSHVEIEQERLAGDLWLRKRIAVELWGHIMLVASRRADLEFTYRDYRKSQADSRILPGVVAAPSGK